MRGPGEEEGGPCPEQTEERYGETVPSAWHILPHTARLPPASCRSLALMSPPRQVTPLNSSLPSPLACCIFFIVVTATNLLSPFYLLWVSCLASTPNSKDSPALSASVPSP